MSEITPLPSADSSPLYENVASHLARLIDGGTFRPNEKIPSVRKISAQLSVSITTALAAYRILESRGYLRARPQSGYYVNFPILAPQLPASSSTAAKTPLTQPPVSAPTKVSIQQLVMTLLHDSTNPDLVKLGAAIPDSHQLPTAKLNRIMARIARTRADKANSYSVPPGEKELRTQIARRAFIAGATLTPAEIVITSGAQEALNLCLRALCKTGDVVALDSPCYYGFLQAIETMGLKALEIPNCPNEGLSLPSLRTALKKHPVKAVLTIATCNNPLGSIMPTDKKHELVALLAKKQIPLIEDDTYGDLTFSDPRLPTCKSFDKTGLVLLISTFSKTLAPGYRVGYVAPGKFHEAVLYQKLVNSLATGTLPQLTIAEFLASGGYDAHIRTLRKNQRKLNSQISTLVTRYFPAGTTIATPQGGHVLWVAMPKKINSLDLYNLAIQKQITIAPGPLFSTKGRYQNYIRLNTAILDPRLEPALKTLGYLASSLLEKR